MHVIVDEGYCNAFVALPLIFFRSGIQCTVTANQMYVLGASKTVTLAPIEKPVALRNYPPGAHFHDAEERHFQKPQTIQSCCQ